jgi:hypothetical protein
LVEFSEREKLDTTKSALTSLGVISNASFWSSNADALARLIEEHPREASTILKSDVIERGASIGRQIVNSYDALGPRGARGAKSTLGEDLLIALLRASKKQQMDFLSGIEKHPWEFAPGKFNPLLGVDQMVANVPEFTKGPLHTCDRYKDRAVTGFSVDARPFNWRDVVPQTDPGKMDSDLQMLVPKPIAAEIENAFKGARMPLPNGVDKKLSPWALNAEVVNPASLVACVSSVSLSNYSVTIPNRTSGLGVFAFDLSFKIDVWLTWSERDTPVSEPKPVAALVSRQEFKDRVGRSGAPCLWEWPPAESLPVLLLDGIWSYATDRHSGTLRACSTRGAVKDHWSDAQETATMEQQKKARDKAGEWVTDKLKEQRANGAKLAAVNSKSEFESMQQLRGAFSAMLQLGFWPNLMSDESFRGMVEDASTHLDVTRSFTDTLAGSLGSEAVGKEIEGDIEKLQKWINDPSRDFSLPRQTRGLKQEVERLEQDQQLLAAAGG